MQAMTIHNLDALWREGLDEARVLQIGLDEYEYVAHDVLLYLVGLFQYRALRDRQTRLILPRSARALDFLRAWKLPEALQEVTGLRFADLIDDASRERWHALPVRNRYERVIDRPGGGRETMMPKTFFALTALRVPLETVREEFRTSPWRTAAIERDRWLQSHIVSVLNLYLNKQGDEVATRVIYESVLNAARHPNATLGFVSAQLVRRLRDDTFAEPVAIEVAIWDNGKTYSETLAERLSVGGSIYSEAYGERHEEFDVSVRGAGGFSEPKLALSSASPVNPTSREALTVAAFMLGVTSKPEKQPGAVLDDDAFGEVNNDPPGSGLYYVRKAVIDKFGGSLQYISGDMRMRLVAGEQEGKYHAAVHRAQSELAPIAGNLLVARIPVQNYEGKR